MNLPDSCQYSLMGETRYGKSISAFQRRKKIDSLAKSGESFWLAVLGFPHYGWFRHNWLYGSFSVT
jgi:hypothetical protein